MGDAFVSMKISHFKIYLPEINIFVGDAILSVKISHFEIIPPRKNCPNCKQTCYRCAAGFRMKSKCAFPRSSKSLRQATTWQSLFPVLLLCDPLSQAELEWQWHCVRFFLYCVRTVITSTSLWQTMEGVLGPSAVIEPCDLRFHVKIVFFVTEFVFCIQANVSYCWDSLSGMG